MAKFTEEELDALSPEEREAIAGDTEAKSVEELRAEEEAEAAARAREEGAGEARRAVEQKTAGDKAEEEAKAAAEEEAAKAKAAKDAEDAAASQAAKEAADLEIAQKAEADAKAAIVIQPKVEPAFVLEVQGKHGTVEEVEAKMAALDTKFEDGDITLAAYNKERAEYVEAITEQKMFATINAQVQKAAAEKGWKDAQATFFASHPEYYGERIKNVAFVDAVNRFLATDESRTMTDAQIFEYAKAECDAVFYPSGRVTAGTDTKNVVDLEAKRAADEAEKKRVLEAATKLEAEKAAGVKTLARVPVAESNIGDDKFDAIDKLSGMAYENAVAKLTDAERRIYASRA